MPTELKRPDTIVLVHGFWVTPRSWEHWITRYEAKGYRVLAPAYPGFEAEVEALNRDPSPVERLTVPAIMAHLEAVVGRLEVPPILMGHSAGGAFVQLLLDRGYGAVGVAINSAPTEGVRVTPLSQLKSTFPVLKRSRESPQGSGVHVRSMALRVHEHIRRSGRARRLRSLSCPGIRGHFLGQRAGEFHPRAPGRRGRLR